MRPPQRTTPALLGRTPAAEATAGPARPEERARDHPAAASAWRSMRRVTAFDTPATAVAGQFANGDAEQVVLWKREAIPTGWRLG